MTSILLVAVTIRMTQDEQPILLPGTDPEAGCMGSVSNQTIFPVIIAVLSMMQLIAQELNLIT